MSRYFSVKFLIDIEIFNSVGLDVKKPGEMMIIIIISNILMPFQRQPSLLSW